MGNSSSHAGNREEPRNREIIHLRQLQIIIDSSELIMRMGPDDRDEEEATWEAAAKMAGSTSVGTLMLIVAAISGKGFMHQSSSRYLKISLDVCLPLLTLNFFFSTMIWLKATEKIVPRVARLGRTAWFLNAAALFTAVVWVLIVMFIAVDAMIV